MRRSATLAALATLLAGTAVAGPHGDTPARALRPVCCAGTPGSASAATASTLEPTPAAARDAAATSAGRAPEAAGTDGDAAEIDALIATLYATVSGPAGAKRDWPRLARLHAPGARLHLTRPDAGGRLQVQTLDFAGFVAEHQARFADRGFHEREVAREVAGFGGVRHVWSTFEARRDPGDPAPYARGINSLQLVHTPDGWRLVSATWDFERAGVPLPSRLAALAMEPAR